MGNETQLDSVEQNIYELLDKLINRCCSHSDAQLILDGIDLLLDHIFQRGI